MANGKSSCLGSLFKGFLCFLLGIIFTLAGIVGGGYYLAFNVKINQYLSYIPNGDSYLSDEWAEKSLVQMIMDATSLFGEGSQDLTINDLIKISPALEGVTDDLLTMINGFGIITVDNSIYDVPFKDLTTTLANKVTSIKLSALTNFVTLPDLAIIQGGEAGSEVWVYSIATTSTESNGVTSKSLKEGFDNTYSYVTKSTSFTKIFTFGADTEITAEYKYQPLYALNDGGATPIYENALAKDSNDDFIIDKDNGGYKLADSYTSCDLYAETTVYDNIAFDDLTDEFIQTNDVFVKTNGLLPLPVASAFEGLSDILDMNSMTLSSIETYFGLSLSGDNKIVSSLKYIPMQKLGLAIQPEMMSTAICDVITIDTSNKIMMFLAYGSEDNYTINPATGGVECDNPNTLGGVSALFDTAKIGDFIKIDENSSKLLQALKNSTFNSIPTDINNLKLGEIIDIDPSNELLYSLRESTLSSISTDVSALTLGEMMTIDPNNKLLNALKNSTLGTIANDIKALTLNDMMTIDESNKILYALKNSTFDSISSDIKALTLGNMMTIDSSDKLLYSLRNSTLDTISTDIKALTLKDMMTIDESNIMLNALKDSTLDSIGNDIKTLKLGNMMTIDPSDKLLYSLRNSTLDTMAEDIKALTLNDMIDIPADNKILNALKDSALSNLGENVNTLKISDMVDIDPSNTLLSSIKNSTLLTLNDDINKLTMQQLYSDNIYNNTAYFVANNTESDNYYIENGGIKYYSKQYLFYTFDDKNGYTLITNTATYNGTEYYVIPEGYTGNVFTRGKTCGIWKYMLTDENGNEINNATINSMGGLIANVTSNMETASLNELKADGIITTTADLNKALYPTASTAGKSTLGELTINETINYMLELMALINP